MLFALPVRRALLVLGIATALATGPAAQGTTGVPTINDYTLNGMTSGSSSCTLLFPFASGPAVLKISTAPNAPTVFLFNLNCPCKTCLFPWVPATCPMPPLTCATFTNQAFELNTGFATCVFLSASATADASGTASITVVVPPMIRFSTQAVLLHPCSPSTLVFTQAYDVSTV